MVTHTVPLLGRLWTIALWTRFVVNCSRSASEPMVRAIVAGGFDGDAVLFCEGEERLGGFFGYEGQVDVFWGEGLLVGRLSRSSASVRSIARVLTDVEAVDEFAGVVVRIVAGHVEKRLGDREWGAQFVGGVGGESLLFGDVCFEAGEHGVEGVGEFAELVSAAREARIRWESDPVAAVRVASVMRVKGASIRPARSHPPRRPKTSRNAKTSLRPWSEIAQEAGPDGKYTVNKGVPVLPGTMNARYGDVSQEEHPDSGQQQGAGEHEEAGVAEGEFEANAQTRGSIHGLLPPARCLVGCRCGSRRRQRWR